MLNNQQKGLVLKLMLGLIAIFSALILLCYLKWYYPYNNHLKQHIFHSSITHYQWLKSHNDEQYHKLELVGNSKIITMTGKTLLLFDYETGKLDYDFKQLDWVRRIKSIEAFTPLGGTVRLHTHEDKLSNEADHFTIRNWQEPENHQRHTHNDNFSYNNLDSSHHITDRSLWDEQQDGKNLLSYHDLLLAQHGSNLSYQKDNDLTILKANETNNKVTLHIPEGHYIRADNLLADYDKKNDNYLWYTLSYRFGQQAKNYPFRIWLVSPDLLSVKQYDLPAGPWVYPAYASCFSCGCACYDRAKLKKRGNLIFAQISGEGVKWKHKGIYIFDLENPTHTWIQLVKGETGKHFSVSEDGKTIAWAGEYAGLLKR